MKLSISQIAWSQKDDQLVGELLRNNGVKYMDIAPSMQWVDPSVVSEFEIQKFQSYWKKYGISFYAMQSVLYKRPDLQLFKDKETRERMSVYLKRIILLAHRLGVKRIVFGSPENRKLGNLDKEIAWDIAVEFFMQISNYCTDFNIDFCIEANPKEYGCDFITTNHEAAKMVDAVNQSNFKMNLDIGSSWLTQFEFNKYLSLLIPKIGYIHISEPYLKEVGSSVDHAAVGKCLLGCGFDGVVGIEMRQDETILPVEHIGKAVEIVKLAYQIAG